MSEKTIREDLAAIIDELHKAQEEGLQIDVASNAFIDRIEAIRRKTADDQWTLMAAALGEIAEELKWLRRTVYAAKFMVRGSKISKMVTAKIRQDEEDA